MSLPAAAAAPVPTSLLARPAIQIALSIVGSVCGTLVTGAAGTSSTGQLIGAALGAAIPTLITVVGPGHQLRAGLGVAITGLALLVTYGGATARDFATDSPATFPLPPGVSPPDSGAAAPVPADSTATPTPPPESVVQRDAGGREIRVTPKLLACTSSECPRSVRVRSTGETAFTVTTIDIEGEFFEHDHGCEGETLAPGEDCRLQVRYRPTSGNEPREATLVIHQNLAGEATRVQLKGTGPSVTSTVDVARPAVDSCSFIHGDTGSLQAELAVSVATADGSDSAPETVPVSAALGAEDIDVKDAPVNGEAVSLVVPIPPEDAVAGLVITVKADPRDEIAERDEDNNVATITAASVPTAGAACSA